MAVRVRSIELRPGYKQTEVGVIPEDWEASSWGKLAILEYGKALRGYENSHNFYPVYGTNGRIGTHNKVLCKHPGVIVGRKGAYRGIHFSKEPFYVIDTAYYLEPKEDTDLKWAYYELLTHDINHIDSGSAIPSTSRDTFYNLSVIVPPLPEQQAIATALSDVDALITSLDKLITKKRDIKQATMQQLLTGKMRLPGFSDKWEVKKLGEISDIGRGRVISHREISASLQPMYPVYSSQTSNNGIMGHIDTYDFEGEYVTWTTDGVNAGTVFYRSGRFNCTNVCGTIKLQKDNPMFVAKILDILAKRYVSTNLANPKLMNDVVKQILVPLPSTLEEQQAIATILFDMDAEIVTLEQRRDKTRALKQGMMQELLTGKTRLL